MPTLNEYTNDDGYYILARPSDTGNITYQLKPRGEQIVEKVGYQDGEEIGWQVIDALKVPNLVYTGDEGTTDNNISVDLDREEIEALSEEDAKELLDELSSVPRVGESQTDEIEEILGVSDDTVPDTEKLMETVGLALHEQGVITERVPSVISDVENIGVTNFLITSDSHDEKDIMFEITILGDLGDRFGERGAFLTKIQVSENRGIVSYDTEINIELTLDLITEFQKLMADMLPTIVSELESMGIDTGPPESLPALNVTSMD